MDKIQALKDLGYNKSIIEDVKKNRRHCDIYAENEIKELAETYECSVEDIQADRVEGIDVYRHDGSISYVVVEC